ncbi:hypothetical protein [Nocardia cyriacigeorgica]|uniref:hypothetical protein n=1 Tax=Nocardia cyriacigeorgica TaxID=135487 RepID=UPI0024577C71|nr:hypothetical protein [Nocardia cyriacigeorgica]
MFDAVREFAEGDPVVWYADKHSRPRSPEAPDAIRRTGIVGLAARGRDGTGPISAYMARGVQVRPDSALT